MRNKLAGIGVNIYKALPGNWFYTVKKDYNIPGYLFADAGIV